MEQDLFIQPSASPDSALHCLSTGSALHSSGLAGADIALLAVSGLAPGLLNGLSLRLLKETFEQILCVCTADSQRQIAL